MNSILLVSVAVRYACRALCKDPPAAITFFRASRPALTFCSFNSN